MDLSTQFLVLSMYITYNSVSIPTQWAVAGPHGQLASLQYLIYIQDCELQQLLKGKHEIIWHLTHTDLSLNLFLITLTLDSTLQDTSCKELEAGISYTKAEKDFLLPAYLPRFIYFL